ncbi:MAG: hypothetical protein JWO94_843 [Verrucomicrobiaceae bacterium]|nr:hypothetical protein [Verrucomicrobiaceae bacterium]
MIGAATPLSIADWTARAAAHVAKVGPWADAFVDRRSRGTKHPVHDFLFTYYSLAPGKLKQWVPALEAALEMTEESLTHHPWLPGRWGQVIDGVFSLNTALLDHRTRDLAKFVAELCERIAGRAPRLRCFGLHEWAMVYRQTPEEVRHNAHALRMAPDELAAFIESQSINCSHYDAYRFFTPGARPLNSLNPQLETRLAMEQGACLHANMDLYKWSTKLWPWVGSDLVAETFLLALEGRDLDMRASPYDLAAMGYEPVRIETEDGRREYQGEQQRLAERSAPVRERLREACARILVA